MAAAVVKSLAALLVLLSSLSLRVFTFSPAEKVVGVDGARESLPFIDRYGRERYFHGENVVIKNTPYIPTLDHFEPDTSLADEDLAIFRQLGWNVVRLGFMWSGAEPERGRYNETYFALMKQLIRKLGSQGIYVLVDFHQDLLSRKFCEDGTPLWAAVPGVMDFPYPIAEPYKLDEHGEPSKEDCGRFSWGTYYMAGAVCRAFQALYDNTDGVLDSLAAYWRKIASDLRDEPGVLGYNLINEPWAGDVYRKPSLLVPGVADRDNLQPMYARLADSIHEVDEATLIIFEQVTWDNYAFGFTEVPGGPTYADRSVVGYHYYTPPRITAIDVAINIQKAYSKRLACGAFLTEFWTTNAANVGEIVEILNAADRALQSWIGWEYHATHLADPQTGQLVNNTLAHVMSRPYAQAVAGRLMSLSFNDELTVLTMRYTVDPSVKGPTEIFVSHLHYPADVVVTITPNEYATYNRTGTLLFIWTSPTAPSGAEVNVTVANQLHPERG